jgi:pimeloyl-ACP methyl ester carboxylesterase
MKLVPFIVLCFWAATTYAQPEPKGGHTRTIVVDGKKMAIYTSGLEKRKPGQPVVIFENGLGVTLNNWDAIFENMTTLAPFVAYDRTGIGKSENDGQLPTLKHTADRLKLLLTALKVAPPYLIVGHSMGGVYARGYAIYYPEDLAGLVFVDPGDFTETRELYDVALKDIGRNPEQIEAFTKNRLIQPQITLAGDTAPVREMQVLGDLRWTDWKEILKSKLPQIPVTFLIAGKFNVYPNFKDPDIDQEVYFRARQVREFERFAQVARTVTYGKVLYSANAGHYIEIDDPGIVLSAIREALEDYKRLLSEKK